MKNLNITKSTALFLGIAAALAFLTGLYLGLGKNTGMLPVLLFFYGMILISLALLLFSKPKNTPAAFDKKSV